ncbi:hypothetical protein FQN50_003042 [Emmonsiellopsis sp. PD_5]|nr:hypothetical protein FQN50_003042 [Emmonsiellopsis sp. PD_5]
MAPYHKPNASAREENAAKIGREVNVPDISELFLTTTRSSPKDGSATTVTIPVTVTVDPPTTLLSTSTAANPKPTSTTSSSTLTSEPTSSSSSSPISSSSPSRSQSLPQPTSSFGPEPLPCPKGVPPIALATVSVIAFAALFLALICACRSRRPKRCKYCRSLVDGSGFQRVPQQDDPPRMAEGLGGVRSNVQRAPSRDPSTHDYAAEEGSYRATTGHNRPSNNSHGHDSRAEASSAMAPQNRDITDPDSVLSHRRPPAKRPILRPPSTSIASIIERYAHMPSEPEHDHAGPSHQRERHRDDFSPQHGGASSGDILRGEARDCVSPLPGEWGSRSGSRSGHLHSEDGQRMCSSCGSAYSPGHPFAREIHEQRSATRNVRNIPGSDPLFPREVSLRTRDRRQHGPQGSRSGSPMDTVQGSASSSATITAPRPARYPRSNLLNQNYNGEASESRLPSDTARDSDANISQMLRRWVLMDQKFGRNTPKTFGVGAHGGPSGGTLEPSPLNIRKSTSTPLPRMLSRLSFSGDRDEGKGKQVNRRGMDRAAAEHGQNNLTPPIAHEDWSRVNRYVGTSHSDREEYHHTLERSGSGSITTPRPGRSTHERNNAQEFYPYSRRYSQSNPALPLMNQAPHEGRDTCQKCIPAGPSHEEIFYRNHPVASSIYDDASVPETYDYSMFRDREAEPDHIQVERGRMPPPDQPVMQDSILGRHVQEMRAAEEDALAATGVGPVVAGDGRASRRASIVRGFSGIYEEVKDLKARRPISGEGSGFKLKKLFRK